MTLQATDREAILGPLNEAQRRAVTHGDRPLLVIAGAGSGKTKTLVHRVAHLIARGVRPDRILLLTFTRRAASEMLGRVQRLLRRRGASGRVWGGTFHATAVRLLRIYGAAVGVRPRFTVHDRGDSEDLVRSLVQELKLNKTGERFPQKGTLMAIHSYMINAQEKLEDTLAVRFPNQAGWIEELRRLFAAYAERKRELDVLDYDDLLLRWCELLEHPEAGEQIRERFDYVLVDEYQDTNPLQGRLLKLLRPDGRGLTVVGDDAQSIYSFRAATVRNILDFPKQYSGARTVKLEQNYRSTQPLLNASNRVLAEAREQFRKRLWSDQKSGPRPQLVACWDEEEQAAFVVQRILEHRRQGVPLKRQAVLFRAAYYSLALETELAAQNLPFVKYGGLKFAEAAHIKDVLAVLRLADNPRDRVAGVRALCLLPGVGPKKAVQLLELLAAPDGGLAAWRNTPPPARSRSVWPPFVKLMDKLAERPDRVQQQLRRVIDFYSPLLHDKYENADLRMKDLEQLQAMAKRFGDRSELLAQLAIEPPASEADLPSAGGRRPRDQLVLSTIHSAKGLEWPVVYVIHAADGMLPQERALGDPEQLEEERRLLYVAMTRAARWLYVCYAEHDFSGRGGWGFDDERRLSRFLTDRAQRAFQHVQIGQ